LIARASTKWAYACLSGDEYLLTNFPIMIQKLTIALFLAATATMAFSCFNAKKITMPDPAVQPTPNAAISFYQFTVNSLEGEPVTLEQFKGKKIIVLNVASKCGYTPQYADWEKYYTEHQDKVVVLGFPSNDFGNQEPGSAAEIAEFCEHNFHVSFPMFEKVQVKGKGQAPVYQWLTTPAQNGWNDQAPSWNFCKYLINEKGELTHFFASKVTPDSPEFLAAIGE
jgi:glutathione peroxidase